MRACYAYTGFGKTTVTATEWVYPRCSRFWAEACNTPCNRSEKNSSFKARGRGGGGGTGYCTLAAKIGILPARLQRPSSFVNFGNSRCFLVALAETQAKLHCRLPWFDPEGICRWRRPG